MLQLQALQALAEQRLKIIDALRQELADAKGELEKFRAHRQWRWRQLARKCFGVRLGIMQQYRPRPLRLSPPAIGLWEQWRRKHLQTRLGIMRQHSPKPMRLPPGYARQESAAPLSISVVTPSYNQGAFLERTIQSVLDQRYSRLQYIIQDGLSTDETVAILDRYRPLLAHCESRKDGGQAHALNLGFRHASGEIMAYLNSDDLLLPGALPYVARYFAAHPDVDVVYGHRIVVDENGDEIGRWVLPPHNDAVLSWADYIPQETLFWRRRIWDRTGGAMDEGFQFALDWELILRFRDAGARFVRLPRFLGVFRFHSQQKTSSQLASRGLTEMNRLRERCRGRPVTFTEIAAHLSGYYLRHCICRTLYQLGILRY